MKKTKDIRLPKAQIAHQERGASATVAAFLRSFTRLRPGRSELVATSIVGGVVVATGLMLAGFGAANRNGLAERYTTPTVVAEGPETGDIATVCMTLRFSHEACSDRWERAMTGIGVELWDGEEDWMNSRCGSKRICYAPEIVPSGDSLLGMTGVDPWSGNLQPLIDENDSYGLLKM